MVSYYVAAFFSDHRHEGILEDRKLAGPADRLIQAAGSTFPQRRSRIDCAKRSDVEKRVRLRQKEGSGLSRFQAEAPRAAVGLFTIIPADSGGNQ